jgi:hypothetical protein
MKLISLTFPLSHYCCVILLVLEHSATDSFGLQRPTKLSTSSRDVAVHAMNRRSLLGGALLTTTLIVPTEAAVALKKKDEVLCGTGFFTNIAQYKCTEIGDILDEGKPKDFSTQELGSMDSLMGKIGISLDEGGSPSKEEDDSTKGVPVVSDNKP